jgi:hypothetical protein
MPESPSAHPSTALNRSSFILAWREPFSVSTRGRPKWRVAFAFDPKRKAILLVAGDKSGGSERRFYRELIRQADDRFDAHLARLKSKR